MTKAFLNLLFLGLCFCLLPLNAPAAERPVRIVILQTFPPPLLERSTKAFRAEMTDFGYKDGTDVDYTVLNAQGDFKLAKSILRSAIDEVRPDLVLTIATLATRAGRQLLSDTAIPQVFMIVTDPVGEGFVSEMGKTTRSNITGQSHVVPVDTQLTLVSEILTTARRDTPFHIGILRSTYPSAVSETAQLREVASQFPAIDLIDLSFPYLPGESARPEMHKSAIDQIHKHKDTLDGLWLVAGPNQSNRDFMKKVRATGVPIVKSGSILSARAGAMIAVQSIPELNGRAAAEAASAILSGTDPGDIPVVRPNSFAAGVNIATAARLGAIIPSEILELAQDNVFHQPTLGN
ncbi:ABC transporter substrate binding protein [Nisaea sp.]|uniref:ABC transporter substrate binding protein n=1 Tax=Nisaea sp. TaxID=2024842 RepID=UPI003265A3ED